MENHQAARTNERQEDLLRRYCDQAEAALRDAKDFASAKRIGDELCDRFAQECTSSMIVHATRTYLDELINHRWGKQNDDGDMSESDIDALGDEMHRLATKAGA